MCEICLCLCLAKGQTKSLIFRLLHSLLAGLRFLRHDSELVHPGRSEYGKNYRSVNIPLSRRFFSDRRPMIVLGDVRKVLLHDVTMHSRTKSGSIWIHKPQRLTPLLLSFRAFTSCHQAAKTSGCHFYPRANGHTFQAPRAELVQHCAPFLVPLIGRARLRCSNH